MQKCMSIGERGEYKPYDEETLTELLVDCLIQVPRYVRVNRVIRDFPTTNVVEGNKKANSTPNRHPKSREAWLEATRYSLS